MEATLFKHTDSPRLSLALDPLLPTNGCNKIVKVTNKKYLLIDFPNVKLAALLVSQWLDIWDLGRLDTAICNHRDQLRIKYLKLFAPTAMFTMTSAGHPTRDHVHKECLTIPTQKVITSANCLQFLMKRNIALTTMSLASFLVKPTLVEYVTKFGSKMVALEFVGHLGNVESWQLYYDLFVHLPRLQALVFHPNSSLICPKDVLDITHKCPLLRKLHFQNKFHLLPPRSMAKNYPKMQPNIGIVGGEQLAHFSLRGYAKSTQFCVNSLAEQCSNLTILDLEGCTGLNDAALCKLVTCLSNIRILNLNYCTKLTATGLLAFVTENGPKNAHLEALHLNKVEVLDELLLALSVQCVNLNLIDLRMCKHITDTGLVAIGQQCTKLETLHLQSNEHLTDTAIDTITLNCSALHTLTAHNCKNLTNVSAEHISRCASLRTLDIGGGSGINDLFLPPSLIELNVSYLPSLGDTHIVALATVCSAGLRKLNISGLNSITDLSIATIAAHCTQLRELYMNELIYVTDAGVVTLVQALGVNGDGSGGLRSVGVAACVGASGNSSGGDATTRSSSSSRGGLAVLSMADCVRVTDEAVVAIAQSCGKGLRCLRLRGLEALTDMAGTCFCTVQAICCVAYLFLFQKHFCIMVVM